MTKQVICSLLLSPVIKTSSVWIVSQGQYPLKRFVLDKKCLMQLMPKRKSLLTLRPLLTRSEEKSASNSHSSHSSSKAGGAAQGMLQHVYVDGATAKGWHSVAFSAKSAPAYACNSGDAQQCINTRLVFFARHMCLAPASTIQASSALHVACLSNWCLPAAKQCLCLLTVS